MRTLPSMQIATIRVAGQPAVSEPPVPAPGGAVVPVDTGTPTPAPDTWAGTFRDDDGSTHEEAIEAVVDAEVTRGCSPPDPTLYCPEAAVTRGQMASFLARAAGLPTTGTPTFADARSSAHAGAVAALAERGIVSGYEDGTFRPDVPVNREQMASFLARVLVLSPMPVKAGVFEDVGASTHRFAIGALQAAGISSGCAPGLYCPKDPVNRAQMASFLARAFELG